MAGDRAILGGRVSQVLREHSAPLASSQRDCQTKHVSASHSPKLCKLRPRLTRGKLHFVNNKIAYLRSVAPRALATTSERFLPPSLPVPGGGQMQHEDPIKFKNARNRAIFGFLIACTRIFAS